MLGGSTRTRHINFDEIFYEGTISIHFLSTRRLFVELESLGFVYSSCKYYLWDLREVVHKCGQQILKHTTMKRIEINISNDVTSIWMFYGHRNDKTLKFMMRKMDASWKDIVRLWMERIFAELRVLKCFVALFNIIPSDRAKLHL